MSHQPLRKEKDCLNCGKEIHGRYCHECGQENLVTRQNFWALTKHFIFDIFHFDGKFFDTLRYLVTRPGKVALEYVSGKRVRYLDPFRMYLFTSAVFFLIFFATANYNPVETEGLSGMMSTTERLDLLMDLNARDSMNHLRPSEKNAIRTLLDSNLTVLLISRKLPIPEDSVVEYKGRRYILLGVPDSLRYTNTGKNQSWLERILQKKVERINEEYEDNPEKGFENFIIDIFHRIPYMLFVSLPFFALILKLIYLRQRRFYYSDHIIFTLYHYIASFILMLILIGLTGLFQWTGWTFFRWMFLAGVIWWFIYLYMGMRRFYAQSRVRTMAKFLLMNFLGFILFILLVICFFLFSIIE